MELKKKFFLFFTMILMITALTSVYNLYIAIVLRSRVESLYKTEILMSELKMNMRESKEMLDAFLLTQKKEYRRNVLESLEQLEELLEDDRDVYRSREKLMIKDLSFLLDKYGTQLKGIMEAKTYRDAVGYKEAYEAAKETASYIDTYIEKVLIENLNQRAQAYFNFSRSYESIQLYSVLLLFGAILLTLFLIFLFTDRFTKPVIDLAHKAGEISQGNFDVADLPVEREDEIGVTVEAFNEMKNNIRYHVEQLKEKSRVEKNLAEERVKNLEMEHFLKNAEMVSLRSQMNPHFLFNTLNTGVQLANMEDAERTADFMEDLAILFRHNVRRMWQKNTLRDEVEGLEYYLRLLKVRFGDTYEVNIKIPEEFMSFNFPPLILQPLLENSILHGLGEKEEGGRVEIEGFYKEGRPVIEIRDDGGGMEEEDVAESLRPISYSHEDFSSRTGVGLRNVILRLRLFYNNSDIVDVESLPGRGTTIRIYVEDVRNV